MTPAETATPTGKSALFLTEGARAIWHVLDDEGNARHYLYCTDPADGRAPAAPSHFDVRRLPAACRDGLDVELLPTLGLCATWSSAVARQREAHATAIRRAIAAGHDFHAPPDATLAEVAAAAAPWPKPQSGDAATCRHCGYPTERDEALGQDACTNLLCFSRFVVAWPTLLAMDPPCKVSFTKSTAVGKTEAQHIGGVLGLVTLRPGERLRPHPQPHPNADVVASLVGRTIVAAHHTSARFSDGEHLVLVLDDGRAFEISGEPETSATGVWVEPVAASAAPQEDRTP